MGLPVSKYEDDVKDNFVGYTVVKKCMLNYLEVGENSNKYYILELHSCNGRFRVFTEYGRLGCLSPRKECRYPTGQWEAENEYSEIKRSKERKGYCEVEVAQTSKGSDEAKKLIDTTQIKQVTVKSDKKKSSLHPLIQSFVSQIYLEAGKTLNTFIKGDNDGTGSPLGKLSQRQIEKGRNVLQEIAYLINNSNKPLTINDTLSLSSDYFRNIPFAFGRKVDPDKVAIRTMDRINEHMDILKFYEDSLRMGSVIYDTNDLDKQYLALNSDIDLLDKSSSKYREINDYVQRTISRHHGVRIDVKNIFTVKQKNAPIFRYSDKNKTDNVRELFHGTRSANMIGILSSHLKLPNQLNGVHITGAMFGPGLYFADQSSKSTQYSCSRFGGTSNRSRTSFMFLAGVALGRIKEENYSVYYTQPPRGYDSVKGCQGPSLLHNEYIVYTENRQELRYIIEFELH